MQNMIKNYVAKLTKEQVYSFALMHNIILSESELNFTYSFIKENYEKLFYDFDNFNIDNYQKYYSPTNFKRIKILFKEYYEKFKPLLHK